MLYFFINPASRSGKGAKKWAQVEHYLKENNIPYEGHLLEADVSPRPILETIFEKEGTNPVSIVLIGGDGTVNQCVNAIPDFTRAELSVIPTGSGNDFCRNKKIPKKLENQISNIVNKKNRLEVDLGTIDFTLADGTEEHRHFVVSTGIGYDAEVCHLANRSKLKRVLNRFKLGKLVYLSIGVQQIFGAELSEADVTVDGTSKHYSNVYFLATMNQPYEGGGVAMAPDADDTDGVLNFMMFHGRERFKALCTIPFLYIKKHAGKPGVSLFTGKDIQVAFSNPRVLHTDGECIENGLCFHAYLEGKLPFIY